MKFGKAINKYRKAKKLSQRELAFIVGVTPTYLSALENDRKEPSIKLIQEICKSLSIPKEILFWESLNMVEGMTQDDKKIVSSAKEIVNSYFLKYSHLS